MRKQRGESLAGDPKLEVELARLLAELVRTASVPVLFLCLVETEGAVVPLFLHGAQREAREQWALPATEVTQVSNALRRALQSAGADSTQAVQAALARWSDLGREIGAHVARLARPGAHIVFLPGPLLRELPLHFWPDADGYPLAERYTVSYSLDAQLLWPATPERAGAVRSPRRGIVVVRAHEPTHRAERRMRQLDRQLAAELGPGEIELLFDSELERASTAALLQRVEVAILLSRSHTPKSSSWQRIDRLPPLLLSLAGRWAAHDAEQGNERGRQFELSLLRRGVDFIVRPFWNVPHECSLRFLQELVMMRAYGPDLSLAEAHRHAVTAVRRAFPRVHHWGSFTLSGRLPTRRIR